MSFKKRLKKQATLLRPILSLAQRIREKYGNPR